MKLLILWLLAVLSAPETDRPCYPVLRIVNRTGEVIVIYDCPECPPGAPCPEATNG